MKTISPRWLRTARAVVASAGALVVCTMGDVLGDKSGALYHLGAAYCLGLAATVCAASLLATRRRADVSPVLHLFVVVVSASAMGAVLALLPSVIREPPDLDLRLVYGIPVLFTFAVVGFLATIRSIALASVLTWLADRALVRYLDPSPQRAVRPADRAAPRGRRRRRA